MSTSARPLRCAVLGAGMAGVLAAIKLRESGVGPVTVFEKGDRFGGTWRENRYPGIACDVPSHLYSYSFAPNPDWSHRFSPGPEIQAYFTDVARTYGIDECTRFGEEVTSLEWRDGAWQLETSMGTTGEFEVVIAATGVLHHPNIPDFEGLETFAGTWCHSSRWNDDIEVAGQRVGVIGTGSTAVQITGAVAPVAGQFTLFQRTPQWIMPQDNPPYSDEQRAEFRRDPEAMARKRKEYAALFTDGIANFLVDAESPQMKMIEDLCRDNLERSVADPVLREQLRPSYRAACKRLVMSADFYDAVQLPSSRLVTEPIHRIEAGGVRTDDGTLHELDSLVVATGFRVDRFIRPTTVRGVGGCDLDDVWDDGPLAYLSISVPEFPNLFMLNGPNGPVGNFSLIDVAELQMQYVSQLVDRVRALPEGGLAATADATSTFERDRREASHSTIWASGCNSWYLDRHGIPATWPWTFDRFREVLSKPDLEHYEVLS